MVGVGLQVEILRGIDRVNRNPGCFRGIEGLPQASMTGIILAIAEEYQHACHSALVWISTQFPASKMNRIEDGGAFAAPDQFVDSLIQSLGVSREVLGD